MYDLKRKLKILKDNYLTENLYSNEKKKRNTLIKTKVNGALMQI